MKMQTIVKYEVIEPVSNVRFFTHNPDVALDRYAEEWIVYEKHKTIGNPAWFVQTEQTVTITWNNTLNLEDGE